MNAASMKIWIPPDPPDDEDVDEDFEEVGDDYTMEGNISPDQG